MTSSDAIIARMLAQHPKGFDLTLERVLRLLADLGNPHLRIPPAIHVAGTNGKGSVVAFSRGILEAAGYRVHSHVSPHLVRYHERYRLASGPGRSAFVDEDRFADALARVEAANAGRQITVFEMLTAVVFVLLSEAPADYAVIEVGLGGRFDATNVIPSSLVSVITPISLDHQAYLGDTVEAIAFEKAGIIKRGRPVVSAPQKPAVAAVLEKQAARMGAPLLVGGQDWHAHEERGRLVYEDGDVLYDLPPPRLNGRHQFMNAGTAIAALRAAGIRLPAPALERGVLDVDWPGRLQRLTAGALVDIAGGAELWIDGGHNPGAGEVLAAALAEIEERVPRPLHMIVGMLSTKDPLGFLTPFQGLARRVWTVPVEQSEAGRDPAELAAMARGVGLSAAPAEGVREAISAIVAGAAGGPPPRILVCGSLYLVGDVLAENGTPPM